MQAEKSAGFPVWPVGIVVGMLAVAAIHGYMIWVAVKSPPVLESGDYYERGLAHQQVIDERAASERLGWTVEVTPCAVAGDTQCVLGLDVRDRDGRPIVGVVGSIDVTRPDDARLDTTGTLAPVAGDGYEVRLALPRGGVYRLDLRLSRADETWVGQQRLWVPAARS